MSRVIVLDIGGEPDELNRIREAVENLAREESWPAELGGQVMLVLEELEMNIMQYAYNPEESAKSRITLTSDADRLTIQVVDHGRPFNPLEDAPAPDLDAALPERQVGGLGIHLARSMMDEIDYRREDGGNRLTLVKRRNP